MYMLAMLKSRAFKGTFHLILEFVPMLTISQEALRLLTAVFMTYVCSVRRAAQNCRCTCTPESSLSTI
jgi:hypothetical protein